MVMMMMMVIMLIVMKIVTNDDDNDDNCNDYNIDYSGVDSNNYNEGNNDKVTNRLRNTFHFSGSVKHGHKLTWKNMSLYEPN
jgi:hypothetical protein